MFRDPSSLLAYEAKRRPEVAEYVTQVDTLTVAQVAALPVPLPWMTAALLRLKETRRVEALRTRLEASQNEWASEGATPDPMGVVREWTGSESFVRIGRNEMSIRPGQLLWVCADCLWLDTVRTTHVDPKLRANTVSRGPATLSAYLTMLRSRANGLSTREEYRYNERPPFQIYRHS